MNHKKPINHDGFGKTLVLTHSGVKGMRRGVRNYQNRDGTWTELGKARRRKGGLTEKQKGGLTEKQKRKIAKKIVQTKAKRSYYEGARELTKANKVKRGNAHQAVGAISGALLVGSISSLLMPTNAVVIPASLAGSYIVGEIGRAFSYIETDYSVHSYNRKIKKADKKIEKLEKKLADG